MVNLTLSGASTAETKIWQHIVVWSNNHFLYRPVTQLGTPAIEKKNIHARFHFKMTSNSVLTR